MSSRVAYAATLATALVWVAACGGDEGDPDPTRSLAAGSERASSVAAESAANNAAPEVARVTFNPPQPLSESPLEAVVEASDPDGNLVHLTFQWKVNGREVDAGAASSIRLPKLERGDRIEVLVTASDGKRESAPFRASVRTENLPPQLTFLYITPQNKKIRRGDVLTAVPEAEDPEGDHIEYAYKWRVNGEAAGDEREFDTKALHRGDKISVEVVANDGDSESPARSLEEIELINSAPTIKQLPELKHQGGLLTYQFEAEDAEGDRNLRFFLADAPDGMEIDSFSGLLTWRPGPEQAGKHLVKVGVKDSEGDASQFEWEVTVNAAATEPTPAARDDE
jgi:hypothetical protein